VAFCAAACASCRSWPAVGMGNCGPAMRRDNHG
jgi:hypothetical protein